MRCWTHLVMAVALTLMAFLDNLVWRQTDAMESGIQTELGIRQVRVRFPAAGIRNLKIPQIPNSLDVKIAKNSPLSLKKSQNHHLSVRPLTRFGPMETSATLCQLKTPCAESESTTPSSRPAATTTTTTTTTSTNSYR